MVQFVDKLGTSRPKIQQQKTANEEFKIDKSQGLIQQILKMNSINYYETPSNLMPQGYFNVSVASLTTSP